MYSPASGSGQPHTAVPVSHSAGIAAAVRLTGVTKPLLNRLRARWPSVAARFALVCWISGSAALLLLATSHPAISMQQHWPRGLHQTPSGCNALQGDRLAALLNDSSVCTDSGQVEYQWEPRRRGAVIEYGPWKVKWPRFARAEHLPWWRLYEVADWRRTTPCETIDHPWSVMSPDLVFNEIVARRTAGASLPQIPAHRGHFEFCLPAETRGQLLTLHNASIARSDDLRHPCANDGGPLDALLEREQQLSDPLTGTARQGAFDASANGMASARAQPRPSVPLVIWADVEAGGFYQHWVQNLLPKFAQATIDMPGLSRYACPAAGEANSDKVPASDGVRVSSGSRSALVLPQVLVKQTLMNDRFPIVGQLYADLGWNVSDFGLAAFHAETFVYPCFTPPLHPLLWRLGQRTILNVHPTPLASRRTLVYASRNGVGVLENHSRRVLNEEALIALLRMWPLEVVVYDHRKYPTINALRAFWGGARLLIGPHGGALTNMVFAGCNTAVIELMPLVSYNRHPPTRHAAMMYWLQAMFLEQEYWMLPATTESGLGDFVVPLQELCEMLSAILGPPTNYTTASETVCEKLVGSLN